MADMGLRHTPQRAVSRRLPFPAVAMDLAALLQDPDAGKVIRATRETSAVAALFGGPVGFDAALERWLLRHGRRSGDVPAAPLAERAVRAIAAQAMNEVLYEVNLEQRAARLRQRARTDDMAREAADLAQEKALREVRRFQTPTERYATRPDGTIPLPFDDNLLGWLRWFERQMLSRLHRRAKRIEFVPLGSDAGQYDPDREGSGEDGRSSESPEAAAVAAIASEGLASFWQVVEAALLNHWEFGSDLLSPDLRADADNVVERDEVMSVGAALASLLGRTLDANPERAGTHGWWGTIDEGFVEACTVAMPGARWNEGRRARIRPNVGYALEAAMREPARSPEHWMLVAGVRAWTSLHLKNFVQRGPSDNKPLSRVEARISHWNEALDWLESPTIDGSSHTSFDVDDPVIDLERTVRGAAGTALSSTATWLVAKGVPSAAKRWFELECVALEASHEIGDAQTRLDDLARWYEHLSDHFSTPPLASLEAVHARGRETRVTKHVTSEAVLLAFIDTAASRLPRWPTEDEQVAREDEQVAR